MTQSQPCKQWTKMIQKCNLFWHVNALPGPLSYLIHTCLTCCTQAVCFILNIQALDRVVSEKKIFTCSSYDKPMADIHAPGRGQFGPQGHGWQDL